MLSLSLLFKRFLKLGATAYGGPAIAGQMKKTIVKDFGLDQGARVYARDGSLPADSGSHLCPAFNLYRYRLRGIWGAFICAIAFVLPAFFLLLCPFRRLLQVWEIFGSSRAFLKDWGRLWWPSSSMPSSILANLS